MEVLLLLLLYCSEIRTAAAAADGVKDTSVETLWVRQDSNITLQCNITNSGELAWYHLRSSQLVLLISAQKTSLLPTLPEYFNLNRSRYVQKPNNKFTVANLTITMVTTHDMGLYFCGTTHRSPQMHFHSAINVQIRKAEDDVIAGNYSVPVVDSECRKALMFGGVSMAFLLFVMASLVACSIISKNRQRSRKHPSR